MEPTKLIPYSVHLREDIYTKLKKAAGERKASSLVRDAITMIIEGDDAFNSGYNKGIRDAIAVVKKNEDANLVAVGGETIAEMLLNELRELIIKPKTIK
jgi:hypothetical protein